MLERWAALAAQREDVRFLFFTTQSPGNLQDGSPAFRRWVASRDDTEAVSEICRCLRSFLNRRHHLLVPTLRSLTGDVSEFAHFWERIEWSMEAASFAVAFESTVERVAGMCGIGIQEATHTTYAWLSAIAKSATCESQQDRAWTFRRLAALYPYLPHELLSLPVPFIGRERQLSRLTVSEFGETSNVILIHGMPGTGKSAFATALASKLSPQYPAGQIYVDARGTKQQPLPPAEIMRHVVEAFRPQPPEVSSEQALRGQYHSTIASKRAILLLDDVHDTSQLAELVPNPPTLLILTSRRYIDLAGARVVHLRPLSLQAAAKLALLLAPRLHSHATELAQLCGGLPVALRIAARSVERRADLSTISHLERLRQPASRADLVDVAIRSSYELLDTALQECWRVLSVFPGTFDLDSITGLLETDRESASRTIGSLLDLNLLEYVGGGRYALHDLLRLFAEREQEFAGPYWVARRHADYFAAFARQVTAELSKQDQKRWLGKLSAENHNLSAALETLQTTGEYTTGLLMCVALWRFWDFRGQWADGKRWLERFVAMQPECDDPARAEALRARGCLAMRQNDISTASQHFAASRSIWERLGRPEGVAASLNDQGNLEKARARWDEARTFYDRALSIWREIKDEFNIAPVLNNLGIVAQRQSRYSDARGLYAQSLQIRRKLRDWLGVSNVLNDIAYTAEEEGNYAEARELHSKSMRIRKRHGYTNGVADSLLNLANLEYKTGDYALAERYYISAEEMYRELGSRIGIARCLGNRGALVHDLGRLEEARRLQEESLRLKRQLEDRREISAALNNLANVMADSGDLDRALKLHQEALSLRRATGAPADILSSLSTLCRLACTAGKEKLAQNCLTESIALARTIQGIRAKMQCLQGAVVFLEMQGKLEAATRVIGAIEELLEATDSRLPPRERAGLEKRCARLEEDFGASSFEQLILAGRKMEPDDAIKYVEAALSS